MFGDFDLAALIYLSFDFGLDHIICCACVFLFLFSLFVRLNSVGHGCLAPERSAHQSPPISTSACVTVVLFLLNFDQIKPYAFVETLISVCHSVDWPVLRLVKP